jgi:hypothetical protein
MCHRQVSIGFGKLISIGFSKLKHFFRQADPAGVIARLDRAIQ